MFVLFKNNPGKQISICQVPPTERNQQIMETKI